MEIYLWEMDRRYEERLLEVRLAETARLAGGSSGPTSVADRVLAQFGSALVALGLRLQAGHQPASRA